ncbi:TetR family transcriptional regulator [Algoriphagus aestuariicola]|jgi:AcrR family transcriptional regulator|uniref:Biofilm operon icaADBC HTH-type negative transcriptional regulator IcaR n=1 Tax=Algoriphagus aestuariicola TaxID=1852016 RepID=A0ABS3BVX8_9BACT|nr:TetR family transcriptional regulator [Algoriphagus aestuariicola]MBN7802461.1 TetR family transcriptional regulator [Algoriphagus aestuariicola]
MKEKISTARKQEIIEGFYRLSVIHGLENTSIAKIGKYLDMPPSLIMHYFPTKDILISNLIDFILEKYLLIYQPIIKELEVSKNADSTLIVETLFSRNWNLLFDDGVFYSCFALIFRNEKIKKEYRILHKKLRESLKEILDSNPDMEGRDTAVLAEQIFVVVEGAYYYLSMFDDEADYNLKVGYFKNQVYDLLRKTAVQQL